MQESLEGRGAGGCLRLEGSQEQPGRKILHLFGPTHFYSRRAGMKEQEGRSREQEKGGYRG